MKATLDKPLRRLPWSSLFQFQRCDGLLCTGHSDAVDEKKARQIGIKGFAMKPLDVGKLAKAVRALLDG